MTNLQLKKGYIFPFTGIVRPFLGGFVNGTDSMAALCEDFVS